ncbi:unnamed protein product [Closterium sp. Naga37s-1]|nr:unnamed protein product [Closterium sp. Naga37s-1]
MVGSGSGRSLLMKRWTGSPTVINPFEINPFDSSAAWPSTWLHVTWLLLVTEGLLVATACYDLGYFPAI